MIIHFNGKLNNYNYPSKNINERTVRMGGKNEKVNDTIKCNVQVPINSIDQLL